jgi:hypothetical protein
LENKINEKKKSVFLGKHEIDFFYKKKIYIVKKQAGILKLKPIIP